MKNSSVGHVATASSRAIMWRRFLPRLLRASSAALLLAMLIAHGVFKDLDHDEHQFVASAALLARDGLMPYRDYAYFHVPYLVAVDAAVFRFTDHLLLGARAVSIGFSFVTILLVARIVSGLFLGRPPRLARLATIAAVALLLADPLWLVTTGRSWNHDLPTCLTLMAFVMVRRMTQRRAIVAGALIGLAAGTRLTFAPVVLGIIAAILIDQSHSRAQRNKLAGMFVGGFVIAMIPCFITFAMAPRQFVFGNLQYPFFNMTYRAAGRYHEGMTGLQKLRFVFLDVLCQPGTAYTFLLFVAAMVVAGRSRDSRRHELHTLLLISLSLMPGALAPTPLFNQYFFTPMLFVLLAAMYGIALNVQTERAQQRWSLALIACVVLSVPNLVIGYHDLVFLGRWHDWTAVAVHDRGMQLAPFAEGGPVLTLAPIYPLEGHAGICPELATGPFAWRISSFLTEPERIKLRMIDPDTMDDDLSACRPRLVLIGHERDLEVPLMAYADLHHVPVLTIAPTELAETRLANSQK